MAKLVNLPNGKQGSFPDDMSNEDIEAVLKKQFPMENVPRRTLNEPKMEETFLGKLPTRLNPSEEDYKSMIWGAIPGGAVEQSVFHATLPHPPSILKAAQSIPIIGNAIKSFSDSIGRTSKNALAKIGIDGLKPGEETLEHINYEEIKPTIEAAKRLDTPLSPAEVTGDPYIGGLQGRYARTSEAAYESTQLGMKRLGKEKKAINKLLDTIYDKSVSSDNKIKDLYQQSYKWNIKPEILNQLKQDPIIENAINEVSSDKAWKRKLGDIPENNYAYLDKVRKSISDKEESLKRSGEKSKANEYSEARHSLVNVMDESVPIYKQARQEAERSITRSKIEKKLKKEEVKGSEFFKKIIENDQEFKKTLHSLRNVPEARKQLMDMKQAWHSLINIEKPSSASYRSENALNQARGSLNKVIELWNQLTGKKKNVEAVKFTRDMDKWVNQLLKSKESGNKSKVVDTLSEILGKAIPTTAGVIREGSEE